MSDLGRGSEAVANYVAICNTIADTYPQSIAHGLQKDAIQNSLDARKGKSTVRVEFSVVNNQRGTFLVFKDSNTTGLTGDVIADVDDYKNLRTDDHWARFEAFAFTKDDPDALGARGQGKFIFLRASNQYKMFYDTFRADEIYRLGATEATKTGRSIYPPRGEKWEDEVARSRLSLHCGLEPLESVGTRVIICDPIPEVLKEINNGEFVMAIQETWFRAIDKQQLEVWLDVQGGKQKIGLPKPYPLPEKDDSKRKTWIYKTDFDNPDVSSDGKFKIKNLHAAYLPREDIAEYLQGIAIIQNGMKITSLPMDIAPVDTRSKIIGFVEFDQALDRELRKGQNQNPNHYQLKWRSKTPKDIKVFINNQLEAFGRKKLGIGEDKREKQRRWRDTAEREAMEQLLRHASDMDLRGPRKAGPVVVPSVPPVPPLHKDIGISLGVQFPDDNKKPRVDWGEEILVSAAYFNKTSDDVYGQVSIRVFRADTIIEELLVNTSVDLQSASAAGSAPSTLKINNGAPFVISIDESRYNSPGEYRIRATLVDRNDGRKIDELTRKFWVAENPPRQMPFNLEPASLETRHIWQASGYIDNNPTIYYNTNHPQFKQVQEDQEKYADYLFDICLEGAMYFMLTRTRGEDGSISYHPLDTKIITSSDSDEVPEKVYQEVSRYIAEVRWRKFDW